MAQAPRSMTGFGRASLRNDRLEIEVEIRSVNHRFLQIRHRLPEKFSFWEPQIEEKIRKHLRRGAVHVAVDVYRKSSGREYGFRLDVAKKYLVQLRKMKETLKLGGEPTLDQILSLPGVVQSAEYERDSVEKDFVLVAQAVDQALSRLNADRAREGAMTVRDMLKRTARLKKIQASIQKKIPAVVRSYREKLQKRLEDLLKAHAGSLSKKDLERELAIFADRSDVTEELTRLKSHIEEFERVLKGPGEVGRKLDFLLQEMGRETNTLGAKASDAGISHLVVEIKGELERIREQVQNLE